MNGTIKHYDRLTGDERFRLVIAAFARGDDTEVEALSRACPKCQYSMNEWAFSQRMEASQNLLVMLRLELEPALRVIRCLDVMDSFDGPEVTPMLRRLWSELRAHENQSITNILAAFADFSRSHWGMDGDEALKAHGDLFADIEYQDEIAEAAADDDAVKGISNSFARMWRQLMQQDEIVEL